MRTTTLGTLAAVTLWSQPSLASEDTTEREGTSAHAVTVGAAGSNLAPIAAVVGYRLRLSDDFQLGAELTGAMQRRSYIGGYEAKGGGAFGGLFVLQGTMLREGPLALDLRGAVGGQYIDSGDVAVPDRAAASVLAELGVIAHIAANDWLTIRAGWNSPFALAVDPALDLDTTGFVVLGGAAFALAERVALTADGHVGGMFGFDGDGAKLAAGGQLGLRWMFGANARTWRSY